MITVCKMTPENVARLAPLYNAFCAEAKEGYRWDLPPVEFSIFRNGVQRGMVNGYLVEETGEPDPIGFMLYCVEDHKAIEINLIYIPDETRRKVILDRLMKQFTRDIEALPNWEVVSFAMLGHQEHLIRSILWYGFKPVGQAIVTFQMMDTITQQILMQQTQPVLPEGYRLDHWQPQYAGETAKSICEAFCETADARWDPRFRSELGARGIVSSLSAGAYGDHIPQCTSVLLKNDVPVGFCFLVQASMTQGNIPLVGVRPSEKGHGFGKQLMKHTLDAAVQAILAGKIGMLEITATLETDNYPAIHMYRRMGFREDYNYPHVYLPREQLAKQVLYT